MKRALLILGIAFAMISCNKNEQKTENFKTAYIDTAELLKEYDKYKEWYYFKEICSLFKIKATICKKRLRLNKSLLKEGETLILLKSNHSNNGFISNSSDVLIFNFSSFVKFF